MEKIANNSVLIKTLEMVSIGFDILSNAMVIAWPITIVYLMIYFN
jgi:hypothetical protein